MRLARPALLMLLAAVIAGCGLFDRRDPETKPAELVDFDSTLAVERLWSANTGRGINRSAPRLMPYFEGNEIWTIDYRGRISVMEAESGRRIRQFNTDLDASAGPSVYSDRVYVGTFDGELVQLDWSGGSVRWRVQLSSEILSLPKEHDGVVIARCTDGRIFGLDADSGRRIWVYDRSVPLLTLRGTSDPLIRAGQAYIGFDDGVVAALRVRDGSLLWEERVSVPEGRTELDRLADIDGPMSAVGRDLYVVTYHGRMASVAIDAGRIQWINEVASHTGLSLSRTRLAATDRDDAVWLVDRQSGATVWRDDRLARRGVSRPVFHGENLVVADKQGYLHWMDAESGEFVARTRATRNQPVGAPIVVGTTVYLFDEDGNLTAWRARPAG